MREKDEIMALQGGNNNVIAAMRRVLDVLKLRLTYEMQDVVGCELHES